MTRPLKSTTEEFTAFSAKLHSDGLRPALQSLLEMTDYRFIGIWRFQGDTAAAAAHFDRLNPQVEKIDSVPASATYCSIVKEQKLPFQTAYAVLDERLLMHPARDSVASYCGVPLVSGGEVIGTLCYYDMEPRDVGDIDLQLMLMVSGYLTAGNFVPSHAN